MTQARPLDLQKCIAVLARCYPSGVRLSDPLCLILWENIGYLIDDERRAALFAEFEIRVGLTPRKIEAADGALLLDIAQRGGMRPEVRVGRWRTIARIVLTRCGGDLAGALRALPLAKARALLKTFPTIGDPGADKILLFSGIAVQPSLDSNGLRVLARLGIFPEQHSYAASYRAAIEAMTAQELPGRDALITAHDALRALGRAVCKRGEPQCLACPLDGDCAHVVVTRL